VGRKRIVTGLFCIKSGRSSPLLCQDIPSLLVASSLFFFLVAFFSLCPLALSCISLLVCFVIVFFLGKTCVLSSLVLHAVCTSLAPACISVYFQVSLEQWAFLLFSFVFGNPYMLLHSGFSEAWLVKKHSYTRSVEWFLQGAEASWSGFGL